MRYVVRVLVIDATGTTQRSFAVDLKHQVQPLLRAYQHPAAFSKARAPTPSEPSEILSHRVANSK